MIKKTLYFGNPAYLSLWRDQLVIKLPEVEKNESVPESFKEQYRVTKPVEDLGVVVLDNKQITITLGLLEALLENNCAVITCDSKCLPVGLMLPLYGNTTQNERFRQQIEASLPLKKQLWQQTIKAKIENQASVLSDCSGEVVKCMRIWASDVRSGDPDNLEARAAAYYWKSLFPNIDGFTRDRDGVPPNNLLNYGYSILRAVVARGLVISGLLPTFGIHHHNRYNAYCLADDIMEPYRPYVDELVFRLVESYGSKIELSKEVKARLLTIPTIDVRIGGKRSPLMVAVGQTTASLYRCFTGELRRISYPER
ncbi:type II CRISPR-associated endonuclease Cas1 [Coprobacter secundus]|uniref:type II CRISPR-associated endonuclease Cas1 n=1 Tax=Coprobacter secundus TaxID=1501392 RepID=UPI00351FA737